MDSYLLSAGLASCKNTSSPAPVGSNRAWSLAIDVIPVVEKTRSDGADVAGIDKHFRASLVNSGNFLCLVRHQDNGSVKLLFAIFTGMCASLLYSNNSTDTH
jgi:hypothetical protein